MLLYLGQLRNALLQHLVNPFVGHTPAILLRRVHRDGSAQAKTIKRVGEN